MLLSFAKQQMVNRVKRISGLEVSLKFFSIFISGDKKYRVFFVEMFAHKNIITVKTVILWDIKILIKGLVTLFGAQETVIIINVDICDT